MSEIKPQVGDRVRVTYQGEVAANVVADAVWIRRDGSAHTHWVNVDAVEVLPPLLRVGDLMRFHNDRLLSIVTEDNIRDDWSASRRTTSTPR